MIGIPGAVEMDVVIRAPSNRMVHLKPLVGRILNTLASLPPGQLCEVGG